MKIFKSTLIAAGLLAAGSMGAQAETVIDLFETSQTTMTVCLTGNLTCNNGAAATPFAESSVSTLGDDIVGLERDMFIQATGTGPNDSPGQTSTLGVFQSGIDGGILSWGNDPGAGSIATVQWDGSDDANPSDLAFGLGLDLSNELQFVVDVLSSDLGFFFAINLYTDATTFTKITLISDGVVAPGGPEPGLALSSWTDAAAFLCFGPGGSNPVDSPPLGSGPFAGVAAVECGSSGVVDLTQVNAIEAIFTSPVSALGNAIEVDLRIRDIKAVPVPSTLALFGGSLMAMGLVLARRRAAL